VARILVVDDEPEIVRGLTDNLRFEGHETLVATNGSDAIAVVASEAPDLVLLDVMMPVMSGWDVAKELRRRGLDVPIIMLTARGEEADRVLGLELGADDYVTKPFSAREVAARIRAVLRRADDGPAAEQRDEAPVEVGGLAVDDARRTATLAGEPLELSRKEFDVLLLLAREAGRVVTRERLLEEVWDTTWFGSSKTLDVHVSGIRRKLGDDPAAPRYLHTVRGVGFRLVAPEEEA
jgi:DNA-binding response OmpR family regulator